MEEIKLRKVTVDDSEMLYIWRNSLETRQYFFNSAEIAKEDHLNWLEESLTKNDRVLLIGELANKPIGVLRYDFSEDAAEISIYLVPGLYGQGLGTKLLCAGNQWLSINSPSIKKVIANVIPENIASKRAFEKAGFQESYITYTYHIGC